MFLLLSRVLSRDDAKCNRRGEWTTRGRRDAYYTDLNQQAEGYWSKTTHYRVRIAYDSLYQ